MLRSHHLTSCVLAALALLTPAAGYAREKPACADIANGRFHAARDLLVVNYDIKPDVDDIHSAAAFATLTKRFPGCFDYMVVAGTYGMQDGKIAPFSSLFNMAFGDRWLNAHDHRAPSAQAVAKRMIATLRAGGDVWIAEGGQSDFTSDVLNQVAAKKRVAPLLKQRVHVVQHSDWNEKTTTPAKLAHVKSATDYRRIADGNAPNNGTPDFAVDDPSWWPRLKRDLLVGAIWTEAQRLADEANPVAVYVNPDVAKGGLDFSDTVEVAYIFGFEGMADHAAYLGWLDL